MEFTAKKIADFLNGEIEGDPEEKVSGVSKIEEGKKGTLTFLANPKYAKYVYSTNASILLINKDFKLDKEIEPTLIKVDDAYASFAALLHLYNQSKPVKKGIEEQSYIHPGANIGENVYIGAFAYISNNAEIGNNCKIYPHSYIGENVKIGDNSIIHSGVKVYDDCIIGIDCIVHAGTVIGSDGFGFAPQNNTNYKKIPQIGNVIIEDYVEIGSNVSIDRATMGSTIIRKGAKLDNLIQVAHNVEIGENTVVVAQVGISGSTKIGKDCMIAGQVGIVGHLNIADNVKIAAQSGVSSSINKEGEIVLGSPASNINDTRKSIAIYRQLPQLRNQILNLEKQLEELKKENIDKS